MPLSLNALRIVCDQIPPWEFFTRRDCGAGKSCDKPPDTDSTNRPRGQRRPGPQAMDHRALIRSSAAAALDRTRGSESFKASISAGTAVAAVGPMLPSALAAFTLSAQ